MLGHLLFSSRPCTGCTHRPSGRGHFRYGYSRLDASVRCYSSPVSPAGSLARAAPLFGKRKESSPQRRAPPRSCSPVFIVVSDFSDLLSSVPRIDGPSESALAQPLTSFSKEILSSRFRYLISYCKSAAALIRSKAAIAKMPSAQMQMHLAHHPVRVQDPRRLECV